jgi:hypothetical protein
LLERYSLNKVLSYANIFFSYKFQVVAKRRRGRPPKNNPTHCTQEAAVALFPVAVAEAQNCGTAIAREVFTNLGFKLCIHFLKINFRLLLLQGQGDIHQRKIQSIASNILDRYNANTCNIKRVKLITFKSNRKNYQVARFQKRFFLCKIFCQGCRLFFPIKLSGPLIVGGAYFSPLMTSR